MRFLNHDLTSSRAVRLTCEGALLDMFRRGKSEELIKTMEGWNPQGRLGQPGEVAVVIRFLVSEEAQWVNGQNVRINGGTA